MINSKLYKYFYIIFLFFIFTRPVSLIDIKLGFFLDLYAIMFGYLFLIIILIYSKNFIIDRTNILILSFFVFCTLSLIWRNDIKEYAKLTMPFVYYAFARLVVIDKKQIDYVFKLYSFSFAIPIILSSIYIILGKNIQLVEWVSKVPRHAGVYSNSHTLAYQMLIFSFIFCYNYFVNPNRTKNFKLVNLIILMISLFCLYKSHTRTALVGIVIFWSIFLFGFNKKYFLYTAIIVGILGVAYGSTINKIFLKDTKNVSIKVATSGRSDLWNKYLDEYINSSIPEKLLGKGIGWKFDGPGFHSDWLRLLVQNGIFGSFLFFLMVMSIAYDIYLVKKISIKYFYLGIILTMIVIMLGSNNFVSFFDVSIFIWIFIGLFYNTEKYLNSNEK